MFLQFDPIIAQCADWQAEALAHMERLGTVELVALPNAEPKATQALMKTFWASLAAEGFITGAPAGRH